MSARRDFSMLEACDLNTAHRVCWRHTSRSFFCGRARVSILLHAIKHSPTSNSNNRTYNASSLQDTDSVIISIEPVFNMQLMSRHSMPLAVACTWFVTQPTGTLRNIYLPRTLNSLNHSPRR